MRLIIVGLGSAGDVHPLIGLGLALRGRGHDVVLLASPVYAAAAGRAGLAFAGLGTTAEYEDALRDPDIWHPLKAFAAVARRLILSTMRRVYAFVEEQAREGTAVLAPITALGARIAEEKLGVPLATVHLQPVLLRSTASPPCFGFPDILGHLPRVLRGWYLRAVDRFAIDPVLAPGVDAFRAELGLPPVRRFLDRWANAPRLVLGLFPEWYAPPQPDWPPQTALAGFPLYDEGSVRRPPPELEGFLAAGAPPVVFTAGTAMAHGGEFFRVSAEACRRSGWRGILLSQFPQQLPADLPEAVRAYDYIPFSQVLPRAAAIVHHGGIGTVAQALAAGIPQLVVPFAHDQPDNALRLRRLGVGDYLLPRSYREERLVGRLGRLLEDPAVAERCRARAAGLDAGGALRRACALVEQALAGTAGGTGTPK